MNFFEHQQLARTQSRRLIVLFALAVALIVIAVDLVVVLVAGMTLPSERIAAGGLGNFATGHPALLVFATLGTLAVIGIASLVKTAMLRSGGGAVARQLGATLVPAETRSPSLRRLRNVIEEIAIASGVPVPEIYVLEQESGINAFAAGYSASDAAITVTQGALERLSRDELQGVIAHEFSHVLNGDMRLNIRLMGVLFGILVIGLAARFVLQNARGSRDSKVGALIAAAFFIMLIGYIGLFFGRLIKSGVSRQREYLADASAVQFTRQSLGIAGALKKIGGLAQGSKLAHAGTEEVSHMLFGDGVGYSSLMSTHPPLAERIRRLDPQFKPEEWNALAAAMPAEGHADSLALAEEQSVSMLAGAGAARAARAPAEQSERIAPSEVVRQVGNPGDDDYRVATALREGIPVALREAARTVTDAMALLFALVLDGERKLRDRQIATIRDRHDDEIADRATALFDAAHELPPRERLPLASIAFPQLHRVARPQLMRMVETLDALIAADGHIALFEYSLARMLRVQVTDALDPSRARVIGTTKLG
ncbi:MAG: M48 family metallopeptidase, partial [Lysobacterales bacterium]